MISLCKWRDEDFKSIFFVICYCKLQGCYQGWKCSPTFECAALYAFTTIRKVQCNENVTWFYVQHISGYETCFSKKGYGNPYQGVINVTHYGVCPKWSLSTFTDPSYYREVAGINEERYCRGRTWKTKNPSCQMANRNLLDCGIPPCGKIWLIDWIILTSLFNACMSYRDRQKPANGTQCPTLMTDS